MKKSLVPIILLSIAAVLLFSFTFHDGNNLSPDFKFISDNPDLNDPHKKDRKLFNQQKLIKDSKIPLFQTDNNGVGINLPQTMINESFEGSFLPAGWTKLNPTGGSGWYQQTSGTSPIPGFNGGTITAPPGGGSKVAFCTWYLGGTNSNDQWLVTPQITNVQPNDSLKFWLRYWPDAYRDSFKVYISTTTPTIAAFTTVVFGKNFAENSGDTNWTEYKFNIGSMVTAGNDIYIGFRESVSDNSVDGSSFSLDLVRTTGAPAFTNDIAALTNVNPQSNNSLPVLTIAPKATFMNAGSANQTNIPVTYKITGPLNYTSNKIIASLNSGTTVTVTFDSTFNPVTGIYQALIYSSLASDNNRSNDTVKTTFYVFNPNYGGTSPYNNSNYFYANSTSAASLAPSQPSFCRLDTIGSVNLILNGGNANGGYNRTLTKGTVDDGQFALTGIFGSRKIKFMGTAYDSVFIGTNGIICFTNFEPQSGNWNPPPSGLPGNGTGGVSRPGIYPMWNDLNFESKTQLNNRLSYKVNLSSNKLIVNYDKAPLFGDSLNNETFQVVLDLQTDTVNSPNSNIVFNYSLNSSYTSKPVLIGLQNSSGTSFLQYSFLNSAGVSITPGVFYDPQSAGVSVAIGPVDNNLYSSCKTLEIKLLIQGMWDGGINTGDTITVNIRSNISPFNIVETVKGKTNSSGNVIFDLRNVNNNTPYYFQILNRNTVETWSNNSGTAWSGINLVYDFTTSINNAFGSNMIFKDGKYCIFNGDVNQDQIIDAGDLSSVENNIDVSGYVPEDLTGDDYVDGSDLALVENNSALNIISVIP